MCVAGSVILWRHFLLRFMNHNNTFHGWTMNDIASFVHSRLDYDNFILVGLPAYLQRRLQAVLNAAARLVFRSAPSVRPRDRWLALSRNGWISSLRLWHIVFSIGMAPAYLNQLVPVSDLPGQLRSSPSSVVIYTGAVPSDTVWQPLAVAVARFLLQMSGTLCCPCPVITIRPTIYCKLQPFASG